LFDQGRGRSRSLAPCEADCRHSRLPTRPHRRLAVHDVEARGTRQKEHDGVLEPVPMAAPTALDPRVPGLHTVGELDAVDPDRRWVPQSLSPQMYDRTHVEPIERSP